MEAACGGCDPGCIASVGEINENSVFFKITLILGTINSNYFPFFFYNISFLILSGAMNVLVLTTMCVFSFMSVLENSTGRSVPFDHYSRSLYPVTNRVYLLQRGNFQPFSQKRLRTFEKLHKKLTAFFLCNCKRYKFENIFSY